MERDGAGWPTRPETNLSRKSICSGADGLACHHGLRRSVSVTSSEVILRRGEEEEEEEAGTQEQERLLTVYCPQTKRQGWKL